MANEPPPPKPKHHGVSGVGAFFIVLLVLIIVAAIAWVVFTQLRARRLGLPPPSLSSYIPFKKSSASRNYPSPAPGGIVGWVKDKVDALKNRGNRTAGGAYEEPLGGSRGRPNNRGFGPLDPDEAWDARVGNEADGYGPGGYYEEQELGLHEPTSYNASTKQPVLPGYGEGESSRGRTRSQDPSGMVGGSQRGLDNRYDEEMGRAPRHDPFDDAAERSDMSMRGVSPRPMGARPMGHRAGDSIGESPPEKRSMFHENM